MEFTIQHKAAGLFSSYQKGATFMNDENKCPVTGKTSRAVAAAGTRTGTGGRTN